MYLLHRMRGIAINESEDQNEIANKRLPIVGVAAYCDKMQS
jgi:hypothetical protein